MRHLSDYLKTVRASGRRYFTSAEALAYLQASRAALNCSLYRLMKQGELVSPVKNLYLVVPPEHQAVGCLPAEEVVPIVMKYRGLDYYACLLTAADYHGASHQKPQVFQVMVPQKMSPIQCGRVRIVFVVKKDFEALPMEQRVVKSGYLNVSTPELTVMDLLRYSHRAGGLNHIATVLSELIEAVDPDQLIALARQSQETAWVQRLGYLLEKLMADVDEKKRAILAPLKALVIERGVAAVPLAVEVDAQGKAKCEDWQVIVNTDVESDI